MKYLKFFILLCMITTINGLRPRTTLPPLFREPPSILTRKPVILVPGYEGSQLEAHYIHGRSADISDIQRCFTRGTDRPEAIWFTTSSFNQRNSDCWVKFMALSYDHETNRSHGMPGIDIRPKDFGLTTGIESSSPNSFTPKTNYFSNLVRHLTRRDYRKGVNLRGAPYDWRKAPHENEPFMTNFKSLIEETMRINNKRPVVLLCHSMGCTFSYYFLRQQTQAWKDEYVRALFIVATPWDGNVKYLYSFFERDDDLGTLLYPQIRFVERTFSALTFLMPHQRLFGNEVLIQSKSKNYTVSDYKEMFSVLNNSNAYEMWSRTSTLLGEFEHPEVDIYCMGGVGAPSISKVIYDGDFPTGRKTVLYDDGDGVLLSKSMRGCLRWQKGSLTGKEFLGFKEFQATHMGVIQDREPVHHIYEVLRDL